MPVHWLTGIPLSGGTIKIAIHQWQAKRLTYLNLRNSALA